MSDPLGSELSSVTAYKLLGAVEVPVEVPSLRVDAPAGVRELVGASSPISRGEYRVTPLPVLDSVGISPARPIADGEGTVPLVGTPKVHPPGWVIMYRRKRPKKLKTGKKKKTKAQRRRIQRAWQRRNARRRYEAAADRRDTQVGAYAEAKRKYGRRWLVTPQEWAEVVWPAIGDNLHGFRVGRGPVYLRDLVLVDRYDPQRVLFCGQEYTLRLLGYCV